MAVYYCDYASGNDTTGNGSTGTPWKTLTKALASCTNSDTILLRGSYADKATYYREKPTTALTGLTIAADTGHQPTLIGTTGYTTWNKTGGATNVYQAAYTPVQCFFVWNDTTLLTSTASVAGCDAAANSYFWDDPNNLLYVNIGGSAPTSIEAYGPNTSALTLNGSGAILRGLTFQWHMQAVYLSGGSGFVTSCTFRYWANYAGGSFSCLNLRSSGNTVNDSSFQTAYKADASNLGYGVHSHTGGYDNNTILRCKFTTGGTSISFASGTGHLVDNCDFSDWAQDAVDFENSSGTVSNCRFINTTRAVHGVIRNNGTSTITVHHCTGYALTGTGVGYGLVADPGASAVWHNNTMVHVGTCYLAQTSGTITAYNNIAANGARGYYCGAASPTITADYNATYNQSVQNYDAVWTQGAHDVVINPKFANPGNYDFSLFSTSPCIDRGVAVTGINEGYRGAAPDIGAFEYVRPVTARRR